MRATPPLSPLLNSPTSNSLRLPHFHTTLSPPHLTLSPPHLPLHTTLSPAAARSAKTVSENMQKLQEDREFLQSVVGDVMREVACHGTFSSLSSTLQEHWQEKEAMERTILE